jgi:hypothetical protein
MIRYDITSKRLADLIDSANGEWRELAAQRTEALKVAGRYLEPPKGNWSKIKKVYMNLQYFKCAYCERPLGGHRHGSGEHHVEHYRPKGSVKAWPTPDICDERKLNYDFATGPAWADGYYLLAYEPWNYATVCGICNSVLKGSYFPIAGSDRGPQTTEPRELRGEKPLLIYPIGKLDTDPEVLITFVGLAPMPCSSKKDHNYRRGRVTIDFFGLLYREELLAGRAEKIRDLWIALNFLEAGVGASQGQQDATTVVNQSIADGSEHASCARAYCKLFREDRARATRLFRVALDYLGRTLGTRGG